MKKKKEAIISHDKPMRAYCHFCGSSVGEISDSTEEQVYAVYDCLKCKSNYCDQCSYGKEIDGDLAQLCLRCDSIIEKIT